MQIRQITAGSAALALAAVLAACGSGSSTSANSSTPASAPPAPTSSAQAGTSTSGAGALSAEATAAATGDIPDNQVFLTFRNPRGGYAITFPEGWAQRGAADNVTFQDKNNVIHIVVAKGSAPSLASVTAQLAGERPRLSSLAYGSASTISIQGAPVIKIGYSTLSQPNPVSGKRVQLLVDRYVYNHAGKVVIVDLGTAKGVDNVDAYRKISRSLRWL
jgi:hypothetical protein